MPTDFEAIEPTLQEIAARRGPLVLEFGDPYCGYCRRALPLIAEALAAHPDVPHVKIADGPGRPLGRSFGVKLWPTLVFLRDGVELARAVRPQERKPIDVGLRRLGAGAQ